jgi:hypothetical protein
LLPVSPSTGKNLEASLPLRIEKHDLLALEKSVPRQLRPQPPLELEEEPLWPFDFDLDTLLRIPDRSAEGQLLGQAIDVRTKAHSLDRPLENDPQATRGTEGPIPFEIPDLLLTYHRQLPLQKVQGDSRSS